MNRLREYLIEYKKLTLSIIEAVEKEDYEAPEIFLNKKQEVIYSINSLEYTREEFIKLSKELELPQLEQKLNKVTVMKKQNLKQKINRALEGKEVSRNYNMIQIKDYNVLNRKI
ncbi:hypothetical protein [Clostridium niameyense]|uniref:hypothetical protein n=1 Tax=Clostridium niameyense TaxID=1622073 RepID=UPI00067EDC58|nr:hypothetical protein [Clostridium niameyense]